MIGYLQGKTLHINDKFLILGVGNENSAVGYKVFTTSDVLMGAENGINLELWIHTVVKDDAIDLYGFINKEDLSFFELLLTVSGIGPKSALNILNLANVNNLRQAISSGETSYLTKISGISKKIADKIVIELKGKISDFDEHNSDTPSLTQKTNMEIEAIDALKALGYTQKEAKDALDGVSKEIKQGNDIGAILKATLKMLK